MNPHAKAFWQRQCELFDQLAEVDPCTQDQRLRELAGQEPELAATLSAMLVADRGSGLLDSGLSAIIPGLGELVQAQLCSAGVCGAPTASCPKAGGLRRRLRLCWRHGRDSGPDE